MSQADSTNVAGQSVDQDARLAKVVELLRDEFEPASEVFYSDAHLLRVAKELNQLLSQ